MKEAWLDCHLDGGTSMPVPEYYMSHEFFPKYKGCQAQRALFYGQNAFDMASLLHAVSSFYHRAR